MKRSLIKLTILLSLLGIAQSSLAKDWFGKNNRWGGFGNSSNCNDWPEWTPMYWMEEMSGNNDNCYSGGYTGGYARGYAGGYANPYQSPYGYSAGAYGANPYLGNPYAGGVPAYAPNPYPYAAQARIYPQNRARRIYGSRKQRSSPFGTGGRTGFSRFGGNNFTNPFSSFNGTSSPFSSFGGGSGSPWSSFGSYGSPMGFAGMPGMNPVTPFSPMGGFGSPMSFGSPLSMGTMGMPGMSPMSGFGGSPFGGGSSFMPFR